MLDKTNSFLKAQTEVLTAKTKYSMHAQINFRRSNFCQTINMYSKNKQIPLGVIWWTCMDFSTRKVEFAGFEVKFIPRSNRYFEATETEEGFRRKCNWSCGSAVKSTLVKKTQKMDVLESYY